MIRSVWPAVLAAACLAVFGCHGAKQDEMPMSYGLMGRPVTLAVAPVHDLTGTGQLDGLALADIFASELAQVPQIQVVPVNQTLAVMYGQGWRSVGSPEQAIQLAKMVNADGLVVLAVSEYDPYDPPRLGLIAEIYVAPPSKPAGVLEGEDVTRSPSPVTSQPAGSAASAPARQVQRIYEAARKGEQESIRKYAALRDPPGRRDWSEYLRSQKQFLRYCSWRTVMELTGSPVLSTSSQGQEED